MSAWSGASAPAGGGSSVTSTFTRRPACDTFRPRPRTLYRRSPNRSTTSCSHVSCGAPGEARSSGSSAGWGASSDSGSPWSARAVSVAPAGSWCAWRASTWAPPISSSSSSGALPSPSQTASRTRRPSACAGSSACRATSHASAPSGNGMRNGAFPRGARNSARAAARCSPSAPPRSASSTVCAPWSAARRSSWGSGPSSAVTFRNPALQNASASRSPFVRITVRCPAIPSSFHTPRRGPGSQVCRAVPPRSRSPIFRP